MDPTLREPAHLPSLPADQLASLRRGLTAGLRRGEGLAGELGRAGGRLRSLLLRTSEELGVFLDTLQQVGDCALSSEGDCRGVGEVVARVVAQQRAVQGELGRLAGCLAGVGEWRARHSYS